MSFENFGFSEAIAFIAIVIAFYYGWQNARLTRRLIIKEEEAALTKLRADLGANFVKIGKNYKLKIFNKGNAPACNVRFIFDNTKNHCLIQQDVNSKFPHERLDPHQSVDLIATISLASKSKYSYKLIWDDDFKADNEKMVYPTI